MTKKLTSLPSTKHQQFYLTTTQSTPQLLNIKFELTNMLLFLKNILALRTDLQKRDIYQLYQKTPNIYDQIFKVNTYDQLWQKLDRDKDDKLIERQQILFLNTILTWLTQKKFYHSDNQNYFQFTQIKALVEWFQCGILEYSNLLRQKIKQKGLMRAQIIHRSLEDKFKYYEQAKIKQQAQKILKQKQQKHKQDKLQFAKLQNELQSDIPNHLYKYKPSLTLSKTKDINLLYKLAPYKNDKKRTYQCEYLQKKINQNVQSDQNRQLKQIQHFKQIQRKKLFQKQKLQNQTLQMKFQQKIDKTICQLEQEKIILDKSQKIKLHQFQTKTNKLSNQKIYWLRNSFNAYNQREQERKIRSIVRQHHNSTQFQNNISQLKYPNLNISPKYVTINTSCRALKEENPYKQQANRQRYERHVIRKMKRQLQYNNNQEQIDRSLQHSKSSLVNLYDKNLDLV